MQDALNKKVELAFLAAFYGGLLTENQRQILSLYCEEDLTLAEVAEEFGITRQAVHESIARSATRLEQLEDALGLAKRFRTMEAGLQNALDALKHNDQAGAAKLIESLLTLDREDNHGL